MNELKVAAFFILLFVSLAKADVAPDPGYTRVPVDLRLETREDLSDYRFFLQSPTEIEEVFLKPNETLTIAATDRGGVKRYTTLIAIPKKNLSEFGENLSAESLQELYKSVGAKKVEDVVRIMNHSFSREILLPEKLVWKNPVYRLERDGENNIKAVQTGGTGAFSKSGNFSYFAAAAIAAGFFLAGAVLILGVWLFRKKLRKS